MKPGSRWIAPCSFAPDGVLEVEVLGPGEKPGTVRVRAISPAAVYEIREEAFLANYVRGAVLRPRIKRFGRGSRSC